MKNPEMTTEKSPLGDLADRLEKLQAEANQGRGVSCIQTLIAYLRNGDIERAKSVCFNEGDKIDSHSNIKEFLIEELFPNQEHPWITLEERMKK